MPSKLVPIEDGAGGQNSKPRKIFAKKDLIEAVRKIAPHKPQVGGGDPTRYVSTAAAHRRRAPPEPPRPARRRLPASAASAAANPRCNRNRYRYDRPGRRGATMPTTTNTTSQVKGGSTSMSRSASVPESNQLTIMETGVNLNARRYNDLKITADRKAVELKKRLDTLACLKMEVGGRGGCTRENGAGGGSRGERALLGCGMGGWDGQTPIT